jgi:plastocyanin
MKFQPQVLAVKAGDTVEWKNQDIVPHNAVSTETKEFDTGTMAVGGSWKHEALKKGTFFYTCTLHLNMKGKLVVE